METSIDPDHVLHCFARHGLCADRCFGSKSGYLRNNPGCEFIPNANVFSPDGKVWWGDLDLGKDRPALEAVAQELGCRLYVTTEFRGRFGAENCPLAEIFADAVWHSGGLSLVGLEEAMAGSGLTPEQFADASGASLDLRHTPLRPEIAQQWRRRLKAFRDFSEACSTAVGLPAWGQWWLHPVTSDQRTPLTILQEAMAKKSRFSIPLPPDTDLLGFNQRAMWRKVLETYPWW